MASSRFWWSAIVAGSMTAAGVVVAQEEGAKAEAAAAEAAAPAAEGAAPAEAAPAEAAAPAASSESAGSSESSGSSEGGGEAAAAPAAPVKPRPAEKMALASHSLLLGIVNTGKHLVAVGDRGNIVVSNDGQRWAQVDVPVRATLTAVSFIDENTGWAVGHDAVVLKTSDGGKTWQLQNFQPELEKPLLSVLFLDAQHGFASGAFGLLLETKDGGTSWAEVPAPPIREDEFHLNGLIKLGGGEICVVGEQGLVGVSPDGVTWEKLTTPYEGSYYGALPIGQKGLIAYGQRGNVYKTDDVHSNNWTKVDLGAPISMFGGTVLPNGGEALVGLSGNAAIIASDGTVKLTKIQAMAGTLGTGTLAGAIPFKNEVIAVGELGIAHISN